MEMTVRDIRDDIERCVIVQDSIRLDIKRLIYEFCRTVDQEELKLLFKEIQEFGDSSNRTTTHVNSALASYIRVVKRNSLKEEEEKERKYTSSVYMLQDLKMKVNVILTEEDKRLIYKQCEMQSATSKEQVDGMEKAYASAKYSTLLKYTPEKIETYVFYLSSLIEPKINKNGYRTHYVRVGNDVISYDRIRSSMRVWFMVYSDFLNNDMENYPPDTFQTVTATSLYKWFEKIHPFGDGNGRVGHLLWAIAERVNTGIWPMTLPPDVFAV